MCLQYRQVDLLSETVKGIALNSTRVTRCDKQVLAYICVTSHQIPTTAAIVDKIGNATRR